MRIIFLSLLVFVVSAGGASAKYSFCNKSSYALSASIGYVDGDRLATRGWWRLRPGQCKVVLTEQAKPGRYFVYAEAIPGHKGPLRTWSGDTALCVENTGFFNLRNQDVCRDDPLRQRKFFNVEVTEAAGGAWQTDFTEASTYTVYSAEVAGVQRLLTDIGDDAGNIDGAMGRETQRALANFRRKKGLSDGYTIDDDIIDALIEEANAREAKLGFFYCNKTNNPVWSAIAEPLDDADYRAKGWWKLEPGDCSKILKGALDKDHYYVYGLIEDPTAERTLTGGNKSFCVNTIMFTSETDLSCGDQELDEAKFRRFEIGGVESATFDFLPEMFAEPAPAAPNP
ncbi:DUF1036 domain-containing protein [Hyphococcus lacteus]|uniref:DUF1036 domain-containing protein n=1 Tax=Hyphococcus lacteus TaxID=3143536 RepID=A0ABV3Z677_9PROT